MEFIPPNNGVSWVMLHIPTLNIYVINALSKWKSILKEVIKPYVMTLNMILYA